MTKVELTEKERAVATIIQEEMDSYGDGYSAIMVEDAVAKLAKPVEVAKGVLGSLIKKGCVTYQDVNGEYNVYYLSSKGYEALGLEAPDYAVNFNS